MANRTGKLIHSVAFDKRAEENPDSPVDYGNTRSVWVQQFTERAEYIHLRGSEAVIAGRLQGRHAQVVVVRANEKTLAIGTDWRMRDVRTLKEYAVRDVTPTEDRQWVEVLVEGGVAV